MVQLFEQFLHDDQVARGTDRQELGGPLDGCQDDDGQPHHGE